MLTSSNSRCGLRLGALLSLTVLGCLPPSGPARPTRPGTNPDEISRAEVDAGTWAGRTAYDLVRGLRPRMLVARGESTLLVGRSESTLLVARSGARGFVPKGELSGARVTALL